MKKYFCDVCVAELPVSGKTLTTPLGPAADLCGIEDLCPRREKIVRDLDVSGLVLAELRRLSKCEQEKTAPAAAPILTGRGAQEEQEILDAMEEFRKKYGPGAIAELSRRSNVDEAVLRDMLLRQKVPLSTWRKVREALEEEAE